MRFSPKPVSGREWTGLAAGVVAVGALFLPWTNLTATRQDTEDALSSLPASDVARNAWATGILAWSGPVLLVLAGIAVVLLGQHHVARVSGLPQLWLIATVVSIALMAFSWLAIHHQFAEDVRALLDAGGIAAYGGIGRYLALAAALVSLVVSVLDARSLRRRGSTKTRRS
ncbi:MAG TPA: hypothetical protein VFG87_08805 [Amycolatopsis sp.]|nr:hypothetical protein [Amycolatopsis sp.]